MERKHLFLTAFLVVVLSALFVFAAPSAPTNLVINENVTPLYDEGAFSVNWTAGGGEAEANYTIYIYAGGVLYTTVTNNSATGYSYTNTTEANYTFTVAGVNTTGIAGANSSNVSMYIDTTAPTITLPVYTNATFKKNTDTLTLNVLISDALSGSTNSICLIDINGTNQTVAVSGGWCNSTSINLTGASDSNQTINAWANDTVNNFGLNNSYVVQIDSTSPTASLGTNPIANLNTTDTTPTFDFKCSDNLGPISHVNLYGNWSSGWHANYTNTSFTNNTWFNQTIQTFSEGAYTWGAYCNDTAGNSDWSINRTFIVDITAPGITFSCSPSTVSADATVTCSCSGSDTISGFNSSTLSYVSNPSTSDTGTYTITCTGSDYAGNSNSETTSYTVESVGSGSGSSSNNNGNDDGGDDEDTLQPTSETPSKQQNKSFEKITPGNVTIIKDFDTEIGLKQIQIQVRNEAQNVKINVNKYDSRPANVSVEKQGKVHKYLQIETENLTESLEKATITIQVEKSWINESELIKDDIALFKFNESSEAWDELVTIYTEEDDTYYYYDVELTSFSYFAIGEKVKADLLWLWIIIGIAVLLLIVGVVLVVLKGKQ